MIKKAAAGYAGWLCANGIVAPEKNKIYAYGMELVLSGLVNSLLLLPDPSYMGTIWRSGSSTRMVPPRKPDVISETGNTSPKTENSLRWGGAPSHE